MTKKKEEREYAKSREEYFREFHRVIAPVGGVTGAVPHMVKKNIGIIANLFIWKVVIVS